MKKASTQECSDMSFIPRRYTGKWVAIKGRRVVGSGRTLKTALKESEKKGITDPTLVKLPNPNESYLL